MQILLLSSVAAAAAAAAQKARIFPLKSLCRVRERFTFLLLYEF